MHTSDQAVRRLLGALEERIRCGDGQASADLAGLGAIRELEARLARYYGAKYAVCVSSATMGLTALTLALDLRGAEVVTTPLSYGATVAPFLAWKSKILFADVEADTLGLDPVAVERVMTPRTRAIVSVDALGIPSDARRLRELADSTGVWYIADAAQSLGARRDGRPASAGADALVVSFGAGKAISVGEGGAVVTDNEDIYRRVIWWTQHPLRHARELGAEQVSEFALNGRMHVLAAVWANAIFDDALVNLARRQAACTEVLDLLTARGLIAPTAWREAGLLPSFFRLSAKWKGKPRPDALRSLLQAHGHEVALGALPIHLLHREPPFRALRGVRGRTRVRCPVAEREAAIRFSLDLRPTETRRAEDERP